MSSKRENPAHPADAEATSIPGPNTDSTGDTSDYRWLRDNGYDNFNRFMQSYQLKVWDHDDVREAQAILRGLRAADAQENPKA